MIHLIDWDAIVLDEYHFGEGDPRRITSCPISGVKSRSPNSTIQPTTATAPRSTHWARMGIRSCNALTSLLCDVGSRNRRLFGNAGEVVRADVAHGNLRVRLTLGVGQAAFGQFRWGGVARGQPADPVG